MGRLKSVLLIDDDPATNFYNKVLLERSKRLREVNVATDGKEALEILARLKSNDNLPDMIFLDLSMHGMDGFEFLDQYRGFPEEDKSKTLLLVLTSSELQADKNKLESYSEVRSVIPKPISKLVLLSLMDQDDE